MRLASCMECAIQTFSDYMPASHLGRCLPVRLPDVEVNALLMLLQLTPLCVAG